MHEFQLEVDGRTLVQQVITTLRRFKSRFSTDFQLQAGNHVSKCGSGQSRILSLVRKSGAIFDFVKR